MLEVMSAGSTGLSRGKGDRGMLVNCWEKPSPLIEELERTVNFAERKCGDLMQQLHYYKEYYEKWAQVERVSHVCEKKKTKKCFREAVEVASSSENEFERVNEYFYKKIKSKINEMSNEISEANRKMHSKSESPPVGDAKVKEEEVGAVVVGLEKKACKSEPTMTSSGVGEGGEVEGDGDGDGDGEGEGIKVTGKQSSKSVPARGNRVGKSGKREGNHGKRRYSNLQRYKIRSKSLPQGVRRKFGFGGFFEVFEPQTQSLVGENVGSRSKSRTSLKADNCRCSRSRKSLLKSKARTAEPRRTTPKNSRHRLSKSRSDLRHFRNTRSAADSSRNDIVQRPCPLPVPAPKREITNTCKDIVPSGTIAEVSKAELSVSDNLKNLIAKPSSLLPFLRHPIPFIPCSSTSKSFNLGLNVQQVLSLIKRKRHSLTLQAIVNNSMQAARSMTEPTLNTLFFSQTSTSHSHVTSAICPAREGSEDDFSVVSHDRPKCSLLKQVQTMRSQAIRDGVGAAGESIIQITSNKVEPCRPEDVWVVDQPEPAASSSSSSSSSRIGNLRTRCTCFPSKHCVDYHKVLRQYTGWRLPSNSSYLCTKSRLYTIPSQDDVHFPGGGNDGRTELLKVHNDLLQLTRKYSSLQEQISQNSLDDYETNAELDAMESELALREVEFKDVLRFYKQLMVLKEKLRSLRMRNDPTHGNTAHPEGQRPKRDPLRPTPSMALAKVLKKIQGLQDKINLIDAP